jgi:TonB family protein
VFTIALIALTGGCVSVRGAAQPIPIPLPSPPRPIEDLARQLDAADAPSRRAAAWGLAGAATLPAPVIERLMTLLTGDESEPVREAAAWALGHIPGTHRETLYEVQPRLLVHTKPVYPDAAHRQRIEGTVVVDVIIDALGRIAHAEIRQSILGLDAAALRTLREWQFAPAIKGGRPVPCLALIPMSYRVY